MKLSSLTALLLGGLALLSISSCSGPQRKAEGPLTGDTIDVLTAQSTKALFDDIRAQDSSDEIWVAYVGVENKSGVPQGGVLDEINVVVEEEFQNVKYSDGATLFHRISNRLVEAGMREAGIRSPGDLVLRSKREAFIKVITAEGHTPDYMMFGTITSIGTDGGARRYRLSLEIMRYDGEVIGQRSAKFTVN